MSSDYFTFSNEDKAYLQEGWDLINDRLSPYATKYEQAIYELPRDEDAAAADLVRPSFVRDVDRILNNPFYNRASDKTQVFSFYRNDDVTRRSFHLQLVSHIARKIGRGLRLNTDLIDAIALGHDMGHTPFGHSGERYLNDLYRARTGRCFNHNVHSVRALRTIAGCRVSLQTFNGILCHCGEKAFAKYTPGTCDTFEQLDALMEECYTTPGASQTLRPNTLEGCVVRISDILAYLGKDRQDALELGAISEQEYQVKDSILGSANSAFIGNVTANIIKNSRNKPYLAIDDEVFAEVDRIKSQNNERIYQSEAAHGVLESTVHPMMEQLYGKLIDDVESGNESSPIYAHHLNTWFLRKNSSYLKAATVDDIVTDYIASMTDDYFIDLFRHLFPDDPKSTVAIYHSYFD